MRRDNAESDASRSVERPVARSGKGEDGDSLRLVNNKNISHSGNHGESCSCVKGVMFGVDLTETRWGSKIYRALRIPLKCKRWVCPDCGRRNAVKLIKRVYEGEMLALAETAKGFRAKYYCKFLTLTAPGDWRGKVPASIARDVMVKNLDKMMRALRKKRGVFHCFWTAKCHRDGYPHLHVLLIGPGVAGKDILDEVRALWVDRYGMGQPDIRWRFKSPRAAVHYMLSYMTKEGEEFFIRQGKRVWSCSKGALAPVQKSTANWVKKVFVREGFDRGKGFQELFTVRGETPFWAALSECIEQSLWPRYVGDGFGWQECPF